MNIRTYSELVKLDTFDKRFEYLKLTGKVGVETFGHNRWMNQILYNSEKWKKARQTVILRDNGCDLGCPGYEIVGKLLIHHMNPITLDDVLNERREVYDPEFLITTQHRTHQAIHYSDRNLLPQPLIERYKNDTSPWLL